MTLARDHFKRPENLKIAIARNWAFKLERMSAEQRRLAEKFINEILFEGEKGNLRRHSVIINQSSQYSLTSSPYPVPYIQSPISHTQSPVPQTPSPVPYIQSPIAQTQAPVPQASRLIPTEQAYLSDTEQPVVIHIPDTQTNENSPTEADTAAKYIESFYLL